MLQKYLGLFKLLTLIIVSSLVFTYGYFGAYMVSPENRHQVAAVSNKQQIKQASVQPSKSVQAAEIAAPAYIPPLSIPILMYHEIGDGPNSLYVSEKNFAAQMQYLYENGYQAVSLANASKLLAEGQSGEKIIALTFDDGYLSFYTKAWPILKSFNFSATVYVITGFTGYYNYLNWDQMKELNQNGIEIGSHTITHPSLTALNSAGLKLQIEGSKAALEQNGIHADAFCYPSGQFNNNAVNEVINAGYKTAVTTKFGISKTTDSPYLISRIRVSRQTDLNSFAKLLSNKQ